MAIVAPKYQLFSHQGSSLVVKALGAITGEANGNLGVLTHDKPNKTFVYTVNGTAGFQITHSTPWEIMEIQNSGLGILSVNTLRAGSNVVADLQEILSLAAKSRDSLTRQFGSNEIVSFKSISANPTEFRIIIRKTTSYILGDS